ncbi:MAG: hypothetical protein K8L99_09020 [Anaerolineae bacterium]|nr:hypothetical protein [Anaerolineae bacterium]
MNTMRIPSHPQRNHTPIEQAEAAARTLNYYGDLLPFERISEGKRGYVARFKLFEKPSAATLAGQLLRHGYYLLARQVIVEDGLDVAVELTFTEDDVQ